MKKLSLKNVCFGWLLVVAGMVVGTVLTSLLVLSNVHRPPAVQSGLGATAYVDASKRFSVVPPLGMSTAPVEQPYAFLSTTALAFTGSIGTYQPINYHEEGWIAVSMQAEDADACYAALEDQGLYFNTPVVIDDVVFKMASTSGAGAGNRYDSNVYRAERDGTCYEITTTLHVSSDWTEVDMDKVDREEALGAAVLRASAESFRFQP